jgi:hypothetical protein
MEVFQRLKHLSLQTDLALKKLVEDPTNIQLNIDYEAITKEYKRCLNQLQDSLGVNRSYDS